MKIENEGMNKKTIDGRILLRDMLLSIIERRKDRIKQTFKPKPKKKNSKLWQQYENHKMNVAY